MVAMPPWLQRWNFIERARIERELWDAFERREDIEGLVQACREAVEQGDASRRFQLEVWQVTLQRIRKIETMMGNQPRPPAKD
jgi:hypothetical protein